MPVVVRDEDKPVVIVKPDEKSGGDGDGSGKKPGRHEAVPQDAAEVLAQAEDARQTAEDAVAAAQDASRG